MKPPIFLPAAFALILSAWGAIAASSAGAGDEPAKKNPEFRVSSGERQLFLDDYDVHRMEKLHRTVHPPQKRGAVIRSPIAGQTIQTRTAPVWDPEAKLYKLWVIGIDQNLWQSLDGLNWNPGPKTNLPIEMAVIDLREPAPSRRFKAPLLDSGFATSPDGIQWTKLDIPKIKSSDEGNFSYDLADGLFIHTVKYNEPVGRSVALSMSRDFTSWTNLGLVFHADERDQELGRKAIAARRTDATLQQTFHNAPESYRVDVYNMGVFRYESRYIGLPAMYHATGPVPNYPNTDGFHLIQLTSSRDLKDWQRTGDRQTFIGPSRLNSGAYDLTQILPPSTAILRDDELWFYYTGLKYRSSFTYVGKFPKGEAIPIPGRERDAGAVCLAVLRRDGFVSLDADAEEGSVTTQPFLLSAGELYVNVDAHGGELRAEVLDKDGQIAAESNIVSGDHTHHKVLWRSGSLAKLEGQKVSLRFTLRNAQFYSYMLQ